MGVVIASKERRGHCVIPALVFSPSTPAVEDDPNSTSTEVHVYIYMHNYLCVSVSIASLCYQSSNT